MEANKINEYKCHDSHVTITVDRSEGTTAMIIACPECGKESRSAWYNCNQDQVPSHEWYNPLKKEAKRLVGSDADHVESGGLLLRKIGEETEDITVCAGPKLGRNELCPCGSNKKYKKCCL